MALVWSQKGGTEPERKTNNKNTYGLHINYTTTVLPLNKLNFTRISQLYMTLS